MPSPARTAVTDGSITRRRVDPSVRIPLLNKRKHRVLLTPTSKNRILKHWMQTHFLVSPSEVGVLTEGLARRIASLLLPPPPLVTAQNLPRLEFVSTLLLKRNRHPSHDVWEPKESFSSLLRGGYFELFSANAHTVVSLRLRSCTFTIWSGSNMTIEVLLLIVCF